MSEGEDATKREKISADQHFTEPPPRYSEAALVKRMEELGIGRPSTYAAILQVLKDRGYVRIDKKRLYPEDKGRVVVAFLESFFTRYVEYDFTAALEEQLDRVSNNEIDWRKVLQDFWVDFIGAVTDIKDLRVTEVLDALNDLLAPHIFPAREDGGDPRQCPNCGVGKLSLKLGKFGAFVGCSNYPDCRFTRQMTPGGDAMGDGGTKVLGTDPVSNLEVTLRSGRFGPYVQLGEAVEKEKPKRSGLPKGTELSSVDLAFALGLLALPREVGLHPDTGEPIKAGVGRFGPYVQHEKTYANLETGDDVLTIGLNRAVTLIEEKKLKGPSRPPLRCRSRPFARRSSGQGRTDRGEERTLWSLCQPCRHQRDAAGRQDAGHHHAGRSRRLDRRTRRGGWRFALRGAKRLRARPQAARRKRPARRPPPKRRQRKLRLRQRNPPRRNLPRGQKAKRLQRYANGNGNAEPAEWFRSPACVATFPP